MNRYIKEFLTKGITIAIFVAAFYFNIKGAQNLIVFCYSIMTTLLILIYASILYAHSMGTLKASVTATFKAQSDSTWPNWYRYTFQLLIMGVLAWHGFIVTATVFVIGLIFGQMFVTLINEIAEELKENSNA